MRFSGSSYADFDREVRAVSNRVEFGSTQDGFIEAEVGGGGAWGMSVLVDAALLGEGESVVPHPWSKGARWMGHQAFSSGLFEAEWFLELHSQ